MAPFTRAQRAANQFLAIWKLCLSFRKRKWDLSDYPVSMRAQEPGSAPEGSRFRLPRFVASIVNWHISGTGESEAEALEDLQTKFSNGAASREAEGLPLPRPGTKVPIKFASQERVNANPELADDFVHRILELEWAWISDESSLWDFSGEERIDAYYAKVKEIYGVDISDIKSGKLCEVVDRISAAQATVD